MSSLPPPPPAAPPTGPPATDAHTCYRHPKRAAGRQCTRCGRFACSECLVQASVGSHCVDCARASRPKAATRARYWNARQPTLVTYTLIAINLAVFVSGVALDPQSLSGRRTTELHVDLALNGELLSITHEWYRLVTSGFLHFGILHLGFNMYMLYLLGQMLEPVLGRVRFGLLYLAALLGGSLGVVVLDRGGLTAGASGAVFGLLGAAFVGQWLHGANPLSTSIGSVLMMNLFITFAFRGQISVGGHVGGLIAGAICGAAMLAPRHKGVPAWASYVVPFVVAVAALGGAVAYVR